jgi:hypothetical protein
MNSSKSTSRNWLKENYDLLLLMALIAIFGIGMITKNNILPAFGFALAALGYLLVILPRGKNFKDDERVSYIKLLTSQITIGVTMLAIVLLSFLLDFEILQISASDLLFYLLGIINIVYIAVYAIARRRM